MATKSFSNEITESEVSIAIERLLIADFPQAWSSARIDLTSLPTGFSDLGAVVEDTPALSVTKSKFTLSVGIPAVRQYEAVTGLEGTFGVTLHSNSWRKYQAALGNYTATCSPTAIATIDSVTDRDTITLAASPTAALAVNDTLILGAAGGLDAIDAIETRIGSISGLDLHLYPTPIRTPTDGHLVATYSNQILYYGSSETKYVTLLGVADFVDGVQIVHYMAKAMAAEEMTEEIRPEENQRIPLVFNLHGQTVEIAAVDQLVVAERHYFPKTS